MKNIQHTRYIVPFLLIIVGVIVFLLFQPQETRAQYAAQIIEECKEVSYRPGCYDEEIPKLMDEGLSMEEAFEVTKIIQAEDSAYTYCHVLGHNISAKETSKNPYLWKEVVTRAPRGLCSNGAIHGAFQERFRVESLPDAEIEELTREIEGICEQRENWDPTPMEQATCTHALGHLTMYVTDADSIKSLALCNEISPQGNGRDMRQLCYDGVFMQLYQPLEPDDFALIEGKEITSTSEVKSFCEKFEGEQRASCLTESWPLFKNELDKPNGARTLCDKVENSPWQQTRCYNAVFNVLFSNAFLQIDWVREYCPTIQDATRMGQCFANAASRLVEVDWGNVEPALEVCRIAKEHGAESACYDEMLTYSSYNFIVGSEPFLELCRGLPGEWQSKCLLQQGT